MLPLTEKPMQNGVLTSSSSTVQYRLLRIYGFV